MAKTYTWQQTESPAGIKERTILSSETVTETKEQVFTLAQKEAELKSVNLSVITAQDRVKKLKAEIAKIKTVFNIT